MKSNALLFLIVFTLILLGGCVDVFRSPHESFVASMHQYVKLNITINELKRYAGSGIAADRYYVNQTKSSDGYDWYHYARLNIWGRYCYYHFVVDPATTKIIGWGFDAGKADPEKECARSG